MIRTQRIPWVLWWDNGVVRWTRWHFEKFVRQECDLAHLDQKVNVVHDPEGTRFPLSDPNAPEWMQ